MSLATKRTSFLPLPVAVLQVSLIALLGTFAVCARPAVSGPGSVPAHQAERLEGTDPESNSAQAETLFKEGQALAAEWNEASLRKAIEKFASARSHWHSVTDVQNEIRAVNASAEIFISLSDYQQALNAFNEELSLSKESTDRVQSLNGLSLVYIYLGNEKKALSYCKRAYQLSQAAADYPGQAESLVNIAEIYYFQGDNQRALQSIEQALTLWPNQNWRCRARALIDKGYSYFDLRDMNRALAHYEQALSQSRGESNRRGEALALTAKGGVYSYLGNKQTALEFHNQAATLFRMIGDHNGEGVTLNGLGYIYRNLGEYQKSLNCYLRALKLFQDLGNREYEDYTLTCVGGAYQGLEDNARALEYFQLALNRSASYSQTKGTALNSIGVVLEKMGETRKALSYYGQALALYEATDDRVGQAAILDDRGSLYLASGKDSEALKDFRKALALSRQVQEPSGEAAALFKIASTLLAAGDYIQARSQIEDSIKIIESLRIKVASQDSRASYFASIHEYYELYVNVLMRLHQNSSDEGLIAAAFDVSEKARARSFLETLKEARSDIYEGVDTSLLEREQRLGRELNTKAEQHLQLLANKKTDSAQVVAAEIDQVTTEYEEVRAQIRSRNPRYAALTEPQPISLKEIQQHVLGDDSLLLEYMLGDDKSYLWLVSRAQVLSYELPGRAEIEKAATDVHSSLIANQPLPDETFDQRQERVAKANDQLSSQIANLSRILLGPVAAKLGTTRLLIVADGALLYIPFQILNAGNDQRPLVVDHEIVNEPSASALALLVNETKNRKPAPNSVAVLADPVFESDDPRIASTARSATSARTGQVQETEFHQALRDVNLSGDGHIPRLLASRDEAKAIMSVAPWRSGFEAMDFEASRATVMKGDLSNYRIVHFATHGLLNNEHPELSGIVLSLFDQQGQPQDGYLRLHDIYNLKLPVDLVVLSACNTGLGKDVKGEGLIGLTRGFMYAGASSVVASLWKVDDEATAELMRLFYGNMLRDGLSPAAALRKAQVTMSQQKRWQSPYYWAGFVIQGQYIPTERVNRFSSQRVVLGLIAAAVVGAAAFYTLRRRRKIIL
jgi:CHAT domain-containing protein